MARKNHPPGAGGGKEKGRSAGDQQTGGIAGGRLGGSGSHPYHTDAGERRHEAGHSAGEVRHSPMSESRHDGETEQEKLKQARIKKGPGSRP